MIPSRRVRVDQALCRISLDPAKWIERVEESRCSGADFPQARRTRFRTIRISPSHRRSRIHLVRRQ